MATAQSMSEKLAAAKKKEAEATSRVRGEVEGVVEKTTDTKPTEEKDSNIEKISKDALGERKRAGRKGNKIEILPSERKSEKMTHIRIKESSALILAELKHKTGKYAHEIIEELLNQVALDD